MSLSILEACRKRKRKPKLFEFHKFADPACTPISPIGTFRSNIRGFLRDFSMLEDEKVNGNLTWCTLLFHENKNCVVPLYTIEEKVQNSEEPFCDHCRCCGWSNHLVAKRKYHMIIPTDMQWNKPLEDDVFDLNSHLLHGLIHCNGFGHLLSINGIESGSKYLHGREIMDLWDRICLNLRARKITVEDLSKKRSMDLRLLYGVSYGHSWFGRWGYKFCHGSYGVSEHNYNSAIQVLSSLEVDKILEDFNNTIQSKEIKKVIRHYRDMSETQLTAINDLLKFMITVKSCVPTQRFATAMKPSKNRVFDKKSRDNTSPKYKKFSAVVDDLGGRWPSKRLQTAAEVVVEALKEKRSMTRQDVRDAARMHIGDTGLLDYVLKSMNNVLVGNHIVRRAVNPNTRILEYTVHDLGNEGLASEPEFLSSEGPLECFSSHATVAGADVYSDIASLYKNVLLNYPKSELVQLASRVILDSKRFVKDFSYIEEQEPVFIFSCRLLPTSLDLQAYFTRGLPPGDPVMVPMHATVLDLKQEVEASFRDTYVILDNFTVKEIEKHGDMEDSEMIFGAVDSCREIYIRGYGIDFRSELRYEGGADNWKVRCECGAQDDDGESMVQCDVCEIWQHTRCCGIEDDETAPPLFVCPGCRDSLIPNTTRKHDEFDSGDDLFFTPEKNYRGDDDVLQFFNNDVGLPTGYA